MKIGTILQATMDIKIAFLPGVCRECEGQTVELGKGDKLLYIGESKARVISGLATGWLFEILAGAPIEAIYEPENPHCVSSQGILSMEGKIEI